MSAPPLPEPARKTVERLLDLSLFEDLGVTGDVTSDVVLESGRSGRMNIIARESLVVCGHEVAAMVFQRFHAQCAYRPEIPDGQGARKDDRVAVVGGPTRSLLAAERTALNFMQRLSGTATLTRRFVDAAAGTGASIVDTRKTTPGWRALQKWAVRVGGGVNHRTGLFDGILIKDNHIAAAGSVAEAVRRARARAHHLLRVEVEVSNDEELQEALAAEPDAILLDNMSVEALRAAVQKVREAAGKRITLEASGNMTLKRVPEVAATGVDLISVGALTHSAPAVDLSAVLVNPG